MPAKKAPAKKPAKKAPAKKATRLNAPQTAAERRRRGRPSEIDSVIGRHPHTHDPVTVSDRIIETIRLGGYMETAAARAGVHKQTVYGWLDTGAKTFKRLNAGTAKPSDLTEHEWRCLEFSEAVDLAEADSEVEQLALLAELGQGGRQVTSTTTRTTPGPQGAPDVVVDRTTKTETLLPDARVLMWRLERRHPARYGRTRVEISGPEGGPLDVEHHADDRVLALVETVRQFKESQSESVDD